MRLLPQGTIRRDDGLGLLQVLLALGVIAVLTVLLFPVLKGAQEKQRDAGCVMKLKGIAGAVLQYAGDHGGALPVVRYHPQIRLNSPNYRTWATQIFPYAVGASLTGSDRAGNQVVMEQYSEYFRCPADEAFRPDVDHGWSYGWNRAVGTTINGGEGINYPQARLSNFPRPSEVHMVADAYHNGQGLNFGSTVSDTAFGCSGDRFQRNASAAPLSASTANRQRHSGAATAPQCALSGRLGAQSSPYD